MKADFTSDVSAYLELDSYDIWGEDFRSNYVTGQDLRADTTTDVEFNQAYIDVKDIGGTPLSLRPRPPGDRARGWLAYRQ